MSSGSIRQIGALLALSALIPVLVSGGEAGFLVPGISLGSVDFGSGSFVEYIIVSHAFGVSDTSIVGISVVDTSAGGVLLEIFSSPYPISVDETVKICVLLCGAVDTISDREVFLDCIESIHVKEGAGAYREPSQEELDEFDIGSLFVDDRDNMDFARLPGGIIDTPAGSFRCDTEEYSKIDRYDVKLGGVDAERMEEVVSTLWLSDTVPLWGLVKCRMERSSHTTIKGGRGGPGPSPTVTESILYSYGSIAE